MVLEQNDTLMALKAFCLYSMHKITKFHYNVLWQLFDLFGCSFSKASKYLLPKINKEVKPKKATTHA